MNGRDAVCEEIQKIRARLLDLSKRNRLLNFKHSKSALKIVDEQPKQVFEYLVSSGRKMTFLHVPEPDSIEDAVTNSENEIPQEPARSL